MYLGGRVSENVSECTHLVAVQEQRSERLLEAIALGKNIVIPHWIIHGYECGFFMGRIALEKKYWEKLQILSTISYETKRQRSIWAIIVREAS